MTDDNRYQDTPEEAERWANREKPTRDYPIGSVVQYSNYSSDWRITAVFGPWYLRELQAAITPEIEANANKVAQALGITEEVQKQNFYEGTRHIRCVRIEGQKKAKTKDKPKKE